MIVDINESWAADTCAEIAAQGGAGSVLVANITDEADCREIAKTCVEEHGRIDILHNNVGRSRGDKETPDLDVAMWDEIMDMNLKGMFMTCKHVLPIMRDQGSGAIINISSTSSYAARQTLAYKTSKGAINTMTQHMSFENAPYGIRVNAILPGLMDTPMAIERRAQERDVDHSIIRAERDAQVPMGAMGTAWDVANAAVFLASEEAAYITGALLPVDGGLLVKRG